MKAEIKAIIKIALVGLIFASVATGVSVGIALLLPEEEWAEGVGFLAGIPLGGISGVLFTIFSFNTWEERA